VVPTGTNYTTTGAVICNHLGKIWQLRDGAQYLLSTGLECVNRQQIDGTVPAEPLLGWTLDARDQFFSGFRLLFLEDVPTLLNTAGNPVKACLNMTVKRWRNAGAIYTGCTICPQESSAWCIGWPLTWTIGQDGFVLGTHYSRVIDPE
jgi:hypothetical protein